jgi:hypothetical protein
MPYLQVILGITEKIDNFSSVCLKFFVQFETKSATDQNQKDNVGCIPKCIYCNSLPLRAFRCCMTLLQQMLLKDKVCRGYTLLNYSYKMILIILPHGNGMGEYAIFLCLSQYSPVNRRCEAAENMFHCISGSIPSKIDDITWIYNL